MGKHSTGGIFGSGRDRRDPSLRRGRPHPQDERTRIPADRVLQSDDSTRLEDAPRRSSVQAAPARLRAERDRRRSRAKKIIVAVVVAIVLVFALGAAGVYAYAVHLEKTMQPQTQVDRKSLAAQLSASKPGEPFNILLMGTDGRAGETSYRTDTIVVAHVDPQQKKVWMLSIPRDTKVMIPGHGYQKINAAHAFGGAPMTIKVIKEFTGLPIDHYMEVNFLGFENAVNQLGGIWVTVPQAINDKAAASQSVHQRAAKIPAGYQKLDGEHALTFVRTRHGFADQDIGRMGDQQIFFKAVAHKLQQTKDPRVIIGVVNSIAPYVVTDMSLMDMLKTALDMKGAGSDNVYTATIPGTWKSPFIYTDDAKKAELIGDLKDGVPFTKSTSATAGGTKASAKTAALKPSAIAITVKNGAGVAGYGAQAASILKTHGFKIKSVGNANQNVYPQTMVIYKKNADAANLVAAALAPGTKVVQSKGMYSYPTEILVVTGKDWNVGNIPAASVTTQ